MDRTNGRRAAVIGAGLIVLATLAVAAVVPATGASPRCGGELATIVGTDQGETIVGTDEADVIVALGGEDTVRGLRGADIVCAGAGKDQVEGGRGRDLLYGGNAPDPLFGGRGRDTLYGSAGDDALDGGAHRDRCFAGPDGASKVSCENPFSAPTPTPAPTRPPGTFQSVCESLGGIYDDDLPVDSLGGPECQWAGEFSREDWQRANPVLQPYCDYELYGWWYIKPYLGYKVWGCSDRMSGVAPWFH